MSQILFTHSYFLRYDEKQRKLGQPYAPLGTLYAAAVMREHGFSVALHDVMFAEGPDDVIPRLAVEKPRYFVIYDDGFNYLTKMCLTNMREAAFRMIELARRQDCKIIVSSSDATDHFEKYLDAGADFVLMGEGEISLLELVQKLEEGKGECEQIPGLAFRSGPTFIRTAKRPVLRDLDSLPLPAWDLAGLERYRKTWLDHAGYFSVNLGTTRGCPFQCNWCAKPIYGNRYHSRSPQKVVEEIRYLRSLIEFDHIWFCDDIFGLKPGWVQAFGAEVARAGLQFRFKIQSRADLLLQESYVQALAAAGCESVWMGAESGSQKILDSMDKGITVEQIERATGLLRKWKIRPCFFIQFGYPGEEKADIEMTLDMIRRLRPHEIGISVSYPLPGTRFYDRVKEQLQEKSNWTDSDDLALMFRNTYPPKFYKLLHRYVHRSYRRQLAWEGLRGLPVRPGSTRLGQLRGLLSALWLTPYLIWMQMRLRKWERS